MSNLQIVEEKVLLRWTNDVLSKKNLKIQSYPEDLTNGVALASLYEVLSGKQFGRLEKPKMEVQKIINVNNVLKLFQEDGVQITCSGDSIVKGNRKALLGLLWCIFRKYHDHSSNSLFTFFMRERVSFSIDKIAEEKLSSVFQNGVLLCALVKFLEPKSEIVLDSLDKEKAVENVTLAFENAERYLGIKSELSPSDVASGKADEKQLLDFILNFLKNDNITETKATHINTAYATIRRNTKVVEPETMEEMNNFQEQIIKLQEQLLKVSGDKKQLEKQVKALEDKLAQLSASDIAVEQLNIIMNSEKEIWSEERKSLFHRIEQLIEEKNSHICRSNSDDPDPEFYNRAIADLENELKQSMLDLERMENDNKRLTSELDEAQNQYQKLESHIEQILKDKKKLEREIQILEDKLSEETENSVSLQTEIKKLKSELKLIEYEEKEVFDKKSKSDRTMRDLEKELKRVNSEKDSLIKQIKKTEEKLEKTKKNKDEESRKLKEKLEEASRKAAKKDEKERRKSESFAKEKHYATMLEEKGKIIESLRQENMKVRQQKDVLERQIVEIQLNALESDVVKKETPKEDSKSAKTRECYIKFNETFKNIVQALIAKNFNTDLFVQHMLSIGSLMKQVTQILGAEHIDATRIFDDSKLIMQSGISLKNEYTEDKKSEFFAQLMKLADDYSVFAV